MTEEVEGRYLDSPMVMRLAREIAMAARPIEDILKHFQLKQEDFEVIIEDPMFRQLLEQSIVEWQSATNTKERIAVKAAVMIEDWLKEAHRRLHDNAENLTAVNALAQTVGRFANIGGLREQPDRMGEKFSVVINLGHDDKISFEKEIGGEVSDLIPHMTIETGNPEGDKTE